jgi:CRP-like cAMP-binding protein
MVRDGFMSPAVGDDGLRRRASAALASSRIFGVLPDQALDQLARAGHPVSLERSAVLFLKGEDGDAAYVVLEGELEVRTVGKDGRELRIAAHPEGGLIGEMAALDGAERSADVVAARRCRLWRVPRAALLEALRSHPEAALALLTELTSRLRAANAALERASRRDLEAQLAFLLLTEHNRLGAVVLTQTEMARRIGFSREKVNRRLHAWADEGVVAIERQGVRIKSAERLRAVAP